MPFEIKMDKERLALELKGEVTVREAAEFAHTLGLQFSSGVAVHCRAAAVEDIDTCMLQMLLSLRKTAAAFDVEQPSQAFLAAVDRCALRHELLPATREES